MLSNKLPRGRAIEVLNGVCYVKSTSKGLSVAYDQFGRIIGKSDFYDDNSEMLIVEMPMKKVITLYPFIGEAFAQIWVLFFLIICIVNVFNWMKLKFLK